MALSSDTKNQIAFKRLVGKAHTQETFAFNEESLTSNISISYQTIFANPINPLPVTDGGLSAINSTDGVVKKVKFEVDLIADTEIGTDQSQGYQVKLPSGETINGVTYSAGTYLHSALGRLQITPPLYGTTAGDGSTEYDPVLYQTDGTTVIAKFDPISWILDPYSGVLFVEQPPAGFDIDASRPAFVEAYLYVGQYMDDAIPSFTGSGTTVIVSTLSGSGVNDRITKWTPDGNTIGSSQIIDDGTTVALGFTGQTGNIDSTTLLHLSGDTSTASTYNSLLRIEDGNQASGYALTSDSGGTATWQVNPVVTGGTLIDNIVYFDKREQLSAFTVDLSALDVNDTFLTGGTFNSTNNTVTLQDNDPATSDISFQLLTMSGLTISNDILVQGNAIVQGNVTIQGTATTINTTELTIEDNVITLNSTLTGNTNPDLAFTEAGIEVLRGSGTTAQIIWNETQDRWEFGLSGATIPIPLQDSYTSGFTYDGSTNKISITQAGIGPDLDVTIDEMSGLTVTGAISAITISADTILLSGTSITELFETNVQGTSNLISKFDPNTSGTTLTESQISDDGTTVRIGAPIPTGTTTGVTLHLSGATQGVFKYTDGSQAAGYVLTSDSGGTATWQSNTGSTTIGAAEDGTYTDGIFTDFTDSTPVGTAVDRFNELFSAIAPPPAPTLDDIQSSVANTGNLSFGPTRNDIAYTNVSGSGIGTSDVDINELYTATGDILGITNTTVAGVLNEDVAADSGSPNPSYPANSFGDAETGSLKLEMNGSVINTLDLSNTGATATVSGGTTLSVSASSNVQFPNGNELDLFKHRTGTYSIATSAMDTGWNYIRVYHDLVTTTAVTNYVEWVYDSDANNITANSQMDSLVIAGSKLISGVEYSTGATIDYSAVTSNAYRNVFADGNAVTFPSRTSLADSTSIGISGTGITDRAAANDKTLPDLDTTVSNPEATDITIIANLATNDNTILGNDTISTNLSVSHPISSQSFVGATASETDLLLYNITQSVDEENEDFTGEVRRLENRDYTSLTYGDLSSGTYDWDSTQDLLSGNTEHDDGLLVFDGQLLYPSSSELTSTYGITAGDFRGLANGPAGNADYSTASGERVYNRRFESDNTTTQSTITIEITHNGTDANFLTDADTGGTPSGNNIKLEFMIKRAGGATHGYYNPFYLGGAQADGVSRTSVSHAGGVTTVTATLSTTPRIADTDIVIIRIKAASGFTNKITNLEITNI